MIKPFLNAGAWRSAGLSGKDTLSLGVHDAIQQIGSMGYGSSTAWGAGIGAAYGGVEGGLSYDGSFFSGAVHGAMVGAAGGAGAKYASSLYKSSKGGAVQGTGGRFAWRNFSDGWSTPSTTNTVGP